MDYREEAVCPECHKIFHPFLKEQEYCLPCTLIYGRKHTEALEKISLTACTGMPVRKVLRRRNEELHRRQALARQYVDMVQRPFEAFSEYHKVLHQVQEFLASLPAEVFPEEKAALQSSLDNCGKLLHEDIESAVRQLLESSEEFESSVDAYAEGLPSCVSGKDRIDLSMLMENLFTENEEKEVDKNDSEG